MTGNPLTGNSPTGSSAPNTGLLPDAVATPPPRGPRSRLPLVAVSGAGVAVLAAMAAFVLLGDRAGNGVEAGPVPTPAARTAAATASAEATAAATAPVSATATAAGTAPASGRNPFLLPGGSAAPSGGATATGPAGGAGFAATPSATASPTYVGLYGFSGSTATFWVNDTKYQVSEGDSFAGFTYGGKTSSSCAEVTGDGTSTTLCAGTVKQLG